MWLITAILRVFQFLFAIVVLGLSVTLAKGQIINSPPATTGYGTFTGGLGVLAAVIGAAALFVGSLEGIISWALDGLAGIAFLAGGIAFAVGLRGTDCSNVATTWDNDIISGGCATVQGQTECAYIDLNETDKLHSRCTSAKADAAFMFLGFILCMCVIGSFMLSGNKRSRSGGIV